MRHGLTGAMVVLLWGASSGAQQPETEEVPSFAQPVTDEEREGRITKEQQAERSGLYNLSVLAGGGFEGFTGGFAPQLQVGPAWGATASINPVPYLGAELAYTGATHEFDLNTDISGGAGSGADVVRNGGHIAATLGLTTYPIQPYVLAGVGLDRYDVRNPIPGFADDTTGYVPLAGGVRFRQGAFTADARFGFNVLFSQGFGFDPVTLETLNGTYYDGQLRLGATF